MNHLAINGYSQHAQSTLNPNASTGTLLRAAKLDFDYEMQPVQWYHKGAPNETDRFQVVTRSDTGEALGVVSPRYKPVQPAVAVDFYRELCDEGRFTLDAIGQVDNGAKIWALARTPETARIMGQDELESYLFFVTGNDGSMATQIKYLSKRLVCNNMLNAAIGCEGKGGWSLTYRHDTTVPFGTILHQLKETPLLWERFTKEATRLAQTPVTDAQAYEYFFNLYANARASENANKNRVNAAMDIYKDHATQQLRSTQGTVWGLVNAVTYIADHRNPTAPFKSAMLGTGNQEKTKAWRAALKIAA